MILTPEEAKGKDCLKMPISDIHHPCMADGCMAWRWHDNKKEKGYCGLAGTPRILKV